MQQMLFQVKMGGRNFCGQVKYIWMANIIPSENSKQKFQE
jgi:hypothetical protein